MSVSTPHTQVSNQTSDVAIKWILYYRVVFLVLYLRMHPVQYINVQQQQGKATATLLYTETPNQNERKKNCKSHYNRGVKGKNHHDDHRQYTHKSASECNGIITQTHTHTILFLAVHNISSLCFFIYLRAMHNIGHNILLFLKVHVLVVPTRTTTSRDASSKITHLCIPIPIK